MFTLDEKKSVTKTSGLSWKGFDLLPGLVEALCQDTVKWDFNVVKDMNQMCDELQVSSKFSKSPEGRDTYWSKSWKQPRTL